MDSTSPPGQLEAERSAPSRRRRAFRAEAATATAGTTDAEKPPGGSLGNGDALARALAVAASARTDATTTAVPLTRLVSGDAVPAGSDGEAPQLDAEVCPAPCRCFFLTFTHFALPLTDFFLKPRLHTKGFL